MRSSNSLFCSDIYQILPHVFVHARDITGRGKRSRMESGGGDGEMCALRSVYVDSSLKYSPLSRVNYYGGHMEGSRQSKTTSESVFSDLIHIWHSDTSMKSSMRCSSNCVLVRHCEALMRRVNTETDPSVTVLHLPPINQSPLVNSGSDVTLTTVPIQCVVIKVHYLKPKPMYFL